MQKTTGGVEFLDLLAPAPRERQRDYNINKYYRTAMGMEPLKAKGPKVCA